MGRQQADRKPWLIAVAVTALLGLVGCPKPRPIDPEVAQELPSQRIAINVYVDGSGSMKNFLSEKGSNPLRDFLTNCESTLRNPPVRQGWADSTIRFWKFGAAIKPLEGTGALTRLVTSPSEFNERMTSIEAPAEDDSQAGVPAKERRSEVKVIVTDLYQSDQASEKPTIALAQKYLTTTTGAIAVFAIRNPYEGPVEDLPGLGRQSLPKNAADSMPFYVIVAGDRAIDVREAQKLFLTETGLGNALKNNRGFMAWFSKDPGGFRPDTPAVDWHGGPNSKDKAVGKFEADHKSGIALLALRHGSVRVSWPGDLAPHPAYEAVTGTNLRVQMHALSATKSSATHEEPSGLNAVTQCAGLPSMCVSIDRSKLHNGETFLYQFNVVPSDPSDAFRPASALMQRWNLEPGDVNAVVVSRQKSFPPIAGVPGKHPGLTPNLSQFLSGLQGQTFHVIDPANNPVREETYSLYVRSR